MQRILYSFFALGLILSSAPVASAAPLTESQIQAILGMVGAFGADNATISSVNSSLRGYPSSPPAPSYYLQPFVISNDPRIVPNPYAPSAFGNDARIVGNSYTQTFFGTDPRIVSGPSTQATFFGSDPRIAPSPWSSAW